jgi:hypothetical protein
VSKPKDRYCVHCLNYGKKGGCKICGMPLNADPIKYPQSAKPPEEEKVDNYEDPWEGIDNDLWNKDRGEYLRRVKEAKKKENRRFA